MSLISVDRMSNSLRHWPISLSDKGKLIENKCIDAEERAPFWTSNSGWGNTNEILCNTWSHTGGSSEHRSDHMFLADNPTTGNYFGVGLK